MIFEFLTLSKISYRIFCLGLEAFEYELPYLEDVPKNPTSTDMFPIVCEKGKRPPLPSQWKGIEVSCLKLYYKLSCIRH